MYISLFVESMNDGHSVKRITYHTSTSYLEAKQFLIDQFNSESLQEALEIRLPDESENFNSNGYWVWEWKRKNNGWLLFISKDVDLTETEQKKYNREIDLIDKYGVNDNGYDNIFWSCKLNPNFFNNFSNIQKMIGKSEELDL